MFTFPTHLPSSHKPQLLASCKDSTLGSDPIYSSSSSNTVKTTWHFNEDKVSLHVGANIFRHNSSFALLYTYEYRSFVGQLNFLHLRPLIEFRVDFVKFSPDD